MKKSCVGPGDTGKGNRLITHPFLHLLFPITLLGSMKQTVEVFSKSGRIAAHNKNSAYKSVCGVFIVLLRILILVFDVF